MKSVIYFIPNDRFHAQVSLLDSNNDRDEINDRFHAQVSLLDSNNDRDEINDTSEHEMCHLFHPCHYYYLID
jgi:hypothetical protein